jgi:general stress protein YciG
MAGTVGGGRKTAAKNLAKDPNFYERIGAIGGRVSTTGGFASDRELARSAGAIGGRASRRTGIKNKKTKKEIAL